MTTKSKKRETATEIATEIAPSEQPEPQRARAKKKAASARREKPKPEPASDVAAASPPEPATDDAAASPPDPAAYDPTVTLKWDDEAEPCWTGPLDEIAQANADNALDEGEEWIADVRAALRERGEYIGGGGAQPVYVLALAEPVAVEPVDPASATPGPERGRGKKAKTARKGAGARACADAAQPAASERAAGKQPTDAPTRAQKRKPERRRAGNTPGARDKAPGAADETTGSAAPELDVQEHATAEPPAPKRRSRKRPAPEPADAAPPRPGRAGVTLAQLAERFLLQLDAEGRSDATIGAYRSDLGIAQAVLGAEIDIDAIRVEDVQRFNASDPVLLARSGQPKAGPTVERTRRVLRLALDFAEAEGWIAVSPCCAPGEPPEA